MVLTESLDCMHVKKNLEFSVSIAFLTVFFKIIVSALIFLFTIELSQMKASPKFLIAQHL